MTWKSGRKPTYAATIRTLRLYEMLRAGDTRSNHEFGRALGCSYKSVERYRTVINEALGTVAPAPEAPRRPAPVARVCEHPERSCDGVCPCVCPRCIDAL